MTYFISKFVRLHRVLLFQNEQICLATYGPQCESLMSHKRMNEAEMLYFHSKLPDQARGTNPEHLGNVFVFVWAYNVSIIIFVLHCYLKSQLEKGEITKTLGCWRNFSHSLQTLR